MVQAPLGKEEEWLARVYPNPGQNKFFIESVASAAAPLTLEIFDGSGKKILTRRMTAAKETVDRSPPEEEAEHSQGRSCRLQRCVEPERYEKGDPFDEYSSSCYVFSLRMEK